MRLILLLVTGLLACGYSQLAGWYPDVTWLQGWLMGIAWPAMAVVLSLILILFFMRPGRNDLVQMTWAGIALSGCMLVIPLIVAREQQARYDVTLAAEMRQTRLAIRQKQLQRNREQEAVIEDRQERAKTDRFVQYEGRIPEDLLAKLRQLDARMLQSVKEQADAYREAMERNPTRGPEDWIRFRTIDQLEAELAAHKALYEQARAFTRFVETFEERYNQAIKELDLQPPADRIAIAEMERVLQDWDRSRLYELRRLDVQLLAAAIRALNLLSDQWGQWAFDPRENRVQFTNKEKEAQFQEAILMARAIIEEVRRIEEAVDSSPTQ